MKRIWILSLVPNGRFGRWWCALAVYTAMSLLLAYANSMLHGEQSNTLDWNIVLFFSVIVAYIIPIFHFITHRTEEAFDELKVHLPFDTARLTSLKTSISQKSIKWYIYNTAIAFTLWLLQVWLLAGSAALIVATISTNVADFIIVTTQLIVWIVMTCAIAALIDNARLFRRLSKEVEIDLLNTRALTPFGRMAVSSTLMVLGSQAAFSIMWLGSNISPWTTIPGMIPTTAALVFLFFAPIWPIHKAIGRAKQEELSRLQHTINGARESDPQGYKELGTLLTYRREILSVHEWPIDLSLMTRLGLYLVIVPLTWIGAALIENVVDLFVA